MLKTLKIGFFKKFAKIFNFFVKTLDKKIFLCYNLGEFKK